MQITKAIKRIILFRFHKDFEVCQNHLALLRRFNPGMDIYGLYGGPKKNFQVAKKLLLKNVWQIPLEDPHWKWLNGDLAVRWWFKDLGKKLNFDILHLWEWDLVLLDSIEKHFAHVRDGVAITDLVPLSKIYHTWDWTAPKRGREEWLELKSYVKKNFEYKAEPLAGVFGGASFSRKFLERYSKIEVPSWCNDEVRTPLFAQAFHMPVYDTNLKSKFFTASGRKVFAPRIVYMYYHQGIKSFHPVQKAIDFKKL